MKELAGSYIEDETGALAPNLADEAMKARKNEEEARSRAEAKKSKGKEVQGE